MTLARPETGFDFRGVQPAPVLRRVVWREARPEGGARGGAEDADHRRSAGQIQVVHDEMNRRRGPIAAGDALQGPDEARRLPVAGRMGPVWPAFGSTMQ